MDSGYEWMKGKWKKILSREIETNDDKESLICLETLRIERFLCQSSSC